MTDILKVFLREKLVYGTATFAVIFLLWQMVSVNEWVNPYLVPPPTKVFLAGVDWVRSGEFAIDFATSFWRGLAGFLIGGVIGVFLGLLTGRVRILDHFLSPVLNVVRAFPPVSLIPVFITFLGIGDISKIFSISFATIFPIWINTHIGASSIPIEYIRSGRLLTQSRTKIFFRVIFPGSLNAIIAGCRISISIAFVMLYVSELAGTSQGLGYQIASSQLSYRMDKMFAALFALGFTAAIVDQLYLKCLKFLFPWLRVNLRR
jgi:ABC-type nitrate/sulfonate/bicarbonate transport system permease component